APDPAKLLAYRLTLDDLVGALERNNLSVGAGYIERNCEQSLVRIPGQLDGLDAIRQVVVGLRAGVPVTVDKVASVTIGKELRTGAATHDDKETVLGTVMLLLGEKGRAVSQAVAAKLQDIAEQLPDGISVTPVYDRIDLVDLTLGTVKQNLFEGALLVVGILFLFLGNLRAALITA